MHAMANWLTLENNCQYQALMRTWRNFHMMGRNVKWYNYFGTI